MLIVAALLACSAPVTTDTGEDADDSEVQDSGSDQPECETADIRINGNDPPVVGDTWTIFLWCSDTLLTGATVVRFDPPQIAELYENEATFIEAGDAMLYMQVGRYTGERSVTVGE